MRMMFVVLSSLLGLWGLGNLDKTNSSRVSHPSLAGLFPLLSLDFDSIAPDLKRMGFVFKKNLGPQAGSWYEFPKTKPPISLWVRQSYGRIQGKTRFPEVLEAGGNPLYSVETGTVALTVEVQDTSLGNSWLRELGTLNALEDGRPSPAPGGKYQLFRSPTTEFKVHFRQVPGVGFQPFRYHLFPVSGLRLFSQKRDNP